MKIANNYTELVGNTPMVQLNRLKKELNLKGNIIAKLEKHNPLSSVKDRIAKAMVEDLEARGLINENTRLVEPTSGNTGIGLAFVSAAKGIKLTLIMPETMSKERILTMEALGAEVILTDGKLGMKGSIALAEKMKNEDPNVIIPQQFKNPANPKIHKATTAIEIFTDLEGDIQAFVSGVGTGGTITGVGEYLKSKLEKVEIIAVEPFESQVLAGGTHSSHKIQGIGAGFIPEVMNLKVVDRIIPITSEEAIQMTKLVAKTEGVLVGISSGAALAAAVKVAQEDHYKDKNIVVVLPDSGERNLSTGIFG